MRMEIPVVLCFRHCFFNPVKKKEVSSYDFQPYVGDVAAL